MDPVTMIVMVLFALMVVAWLVLPAKAEVDAPVATIETDVSSPVAA